MDRMEEELESILKGLGEVDLSNPILKLKPSHDLIFNLAKWNPVEEKEIIQTLLLMNPTNDFVAFKVRATHPRRYLAGPSSGVIPPMSQINIKVALNPAEVDGQGVISLVNSKKKDRIAVLSVPLDRSIEQKQLHSFWDALIKRHNVKERKPAFHDMILRCKVVDSVEKEDEISEKESIASYGTETSNVAKSASEPPDSPVRMNEESPVSQETDKDIPRPTLSSSFEYVENIRPVDSQCIQVKKDILVELEQKAKDYDSVLKYTVTLTKKIEILESRLESSVRENQQASMEIESLKKNIVQLNSQLTEKAKDDEKAASSTASTSDFAAAANSIKQKFLASEEMMKDMRRLNDTAADLISSSTESNKGGVQLFHLLILALSFFILGRIW